MQVLKFCCKDFDEILHMVTLCHPVPCKQLVFYIRQRSRLQRGVCVCCTCTPYFTMNDGSYWKYVYMKVLQMISNIYQWFWPKSKVKVTISNQGRTISKIDDFYVDVWQLCSLGTWDWEHIWMACHLFWFVFVTPGTFLILAHKNFKVFEKCRNCIFDLCA